MVVTSADSSSTVVWHDLECGAYRADLPLWHELAGDAGGGEILDVGAGSGRVTLELARAGHSMTAVDLDAELLDALGARAGTPAPTLVRDDARELELDRRDFALCIVPMQTLQMLDGPAGRAAFLTRARAHLRDGGLLACAIVTQLDAFDCRNSHDGPAPERVSVGGIDYVSRAVRVSIDRRRIRIERERTILRPGGAGRAPIEHDVIELDRLSSAGLAREGRRAGLRPAGVRSIPATDEHVGSEVVLLRV
ncbi:MAG TPA: class I SAM-dependent methyltransferase [Solirubrobacteraceae bacterium]|jgi:SAM-dependent methyltransferase